jgi:hypothetical protein
MIMNTATEILTITFVHFITICLYQKGKWALPGNFIIKKIWSLLLNCYERHPYSVCLQKGVLFSGEKARKKILMYLSLKGN